MADRKPRWRMTLVELCSRTGTRPPDLETWASSGVLGPAFAESSEGKWRHITKEVASRALLTRCLLDAGMTLEGAAKILNGKYEVVVEDGQTKIVADKLTFLVSSSKLEL